MKFFFRIIFIFLFVYVLSAFGYIPIVKVAAQGPPPPPPPGPCEVTTNPSARNLNTGQTAVVSASVTSGLDTATVVQMNFGSYNTAIATVSPISDSIFPYSTTVTAVAAGNTSVWATATLSDGRTCPSTAATDTDMIVTDPVFSISGTVSNTKTGGVFPNIDVKLYKGGVQIATDITDGAGMYSFGNLLAGTYTVTITIPAGKKKTTSDSATVSVGPSRIVNFGMVNTYEIKGTVYINVCGGVSYDPCDTKRSGETIILSGDESGTKVTDASGNYSFINVGEGSYTVALKMPTGYRSVTANSVNVDLGGNMSVDFGIAPLNILKVGGQCNDNTLDIIIVIDHSSSMNEKDGKDPAKRSKLVVAKEASNAFVGIVAKNLPTARIGVVQFSNSKDYPDNEDTSLIAPLTIVDSAGVTSVTKVISSIGKSEGTCHECGIDLANKELLAKTRSKAQKIVILMTDGRANETTTSDGGSVSDSKAENVTMARVMEGVNSQNIVYNTIGLGNSSQLNEAFLEQIANTNYGNYYNDPKHGELRQIYDSIVFKFVPTGLISGFIFEDKDNIGDPGYGKYNPPAEGPLPNIPLQLSSTNPNALPGGGPITTQTDLNGNYSFPGLCTANFTVTEQALPVWLLTTGKSSYTYDVISGEEYPDNDFGFRYGYTISGKVFNDINKNKKFDVGIDEDYTGPVSINRSPSRGAVTVNADNSYIIQGLEEDAYTVSFASTLLPGFNPVYPDPAVFDGVRVGLACNVGSKGVIIGASCSNGNVANLNFAVSNSMPWWQTYGLDVRKEISFDNPIPVAPDPACEGGPFASGTITGSFDSPGIIFSGSGSPGFGKGRASKEDWLVGGGAYPELFDAAAALKTSWKSLIEAAAKAGIEEKPFNCNGCKLPSGSGFYHTDSDMILDKDETFTGGNHIFVSDGTITFAKDRKIKAQNGATVIFSAKEDIIIESDRGTSAKCPVQEGQIQGILSADRNIIVKPKRPDADGNNDCSFEEEDNMLNVEGTLIANAARKGGIFDNRRDLCGGNPKWPTITIKARPDFILNVPGFITEQNIISHEETP